MRIKDTFYALIVLLLLCVSISFAQPKSQVCEEFIQFTLEEKTLGDAQGNMFMTWSKTNIYCLCNSKLYDAQTFALNNRSCDNLEGMTFEDVNQTFQTYKVTNVITNIQDTILQSVIEKNNISHEQIAAQIGEEPIKSEQKEISLTTIIIIAISFIVVIFFSIKTLLKF